MTLWAADPDGYSNLIKLSSLASLEGYYYKPRMDRELLARYAAASSAPPVAPAAR